MNRARLVLGLAFVVLAVSVPVGAGEPDARVTPLQLTVARLGEEARYFDPAAIVGISVRRLDNGEVASFQGDHWIKTASVLKPTWVTAAINRSGIEAVAPFAQQVWVQSSNRAGGTMIDLAGGLDAVNRYTAAAGMSGTLVVEWTFGRDRRSSEYPGPRPALNFTTADDLVAFWSLAYRGWLMSWGQTTQFLEWARLERQPSYPSGLLTRLPAGIESHAYYKMGWLPPGRTEEDEDTGEIVEVDALDVLIGGGVIAVPGEPAYAVAIGAMGGESWPGKIAYVAYASCRIHEVIVAADLDCDRGGDPRRVRANSDAPIGGVVRASATTDRAVIQGWAVDPDSPLDPVAVAVSVDGARVRVAAADQAASWGADPSLVGRGHGFAFWIPVSLEPGDHEVCAVALNDGAGRHTEIGCVKVVVGG